MSMVLIMVGRDDMSLAGELKMRMGGEEGMGLTRCHHERGGWNGKILRVLC